MTIRIGLIGAGVMGADHAHNIASAVGGATLAAIHDADETRARSLASECGNPRVIRSAEALIADPGIDAVLVASPDATHAPLAIACIQAGKPILVEKPVASTIEAARAVVDAEMAGGRRLVQVGFMRRFDPGYLAMRETVVSNRLGPPLFLHCVHRNAVGPDYLTSELVIANSGVHEIDIARFLLGEEIAAVTVRSPRASSRARNRQPQFLVLETTSGIVVDAELFMDSVYGYEVKGELVCETGAVLLTPANPIATREAGHEMFPVEPDWRQRFKTAYREQLIGWVAAINGGAPKGASAWDGYVASLTAEVCLDAWRSGARTQVRSEAVPAIYR